MARHVLARGVRTVSGAIVLPNGGRVDARLGLFFGGASFRWWSGTGHDYSGDIRSYLPHGAGVSVAAPRPGGGYHSSQQPIERGISAGSAIAGRFRVAGEAELALYESGRRFPEGYEPEPDDLYPVYGGAPAIGEHPETNARLVWEWAPGGALRAEAEGNGVLASIEFQGQGTVDRADWDVGIVQDGYFEEAAYAQASWDGIPDGAPKLGKAWWGRHDGLPENPLQLGASLEMGTGYVKLLNWGWIRASRDWGTLAEASGGFWVPRVADASLDAVYMAAPCPAPVSWHFVRSWTHVADGAILEEPIPVEEGASGQTAQFDVEQRHDWVDRVRLLNKDVASEEASGAWSPASGLVGGVWKVFEHYEDQTGPVYAWASPPEGCLQGDWRLGWRGREYRAFRLELEDSLPVEGAWGAPGADGLRTLAPADPWAFENYRFLRLAGHGGDGELRIGGKAFRFGPEDPAWVDLCRPSNAPPAAEGFRTRFPLDADGRPSDPGGWLWGVVSAPSVRCALEPVLSLAGRYGLLHHGLAEHLEWLEWKPDFHHANESGGSGEWDEKYRILRCFLAEDCGRQTLEGFHVVRTESTAPGRRYRYEYRHLAIAEMCRRLVEDPAGRINPAWRVVVETAFPDGYHTLDRPAFWLGHGWTVRDGVWRRGWERSGSDWACAQPAWDAIEWEGLLGDVFRVGGGDLYRLRLVARKCWRGRSYGLAFGVPTGSPMEYCDSDGSDPLEGPIEPTQRHAGGPTLSVPSAWGLTRLQAERALAVGTGDRERSYDRAAFLLGGTPAVLGRLHAVRSGLDGSATVLESGSFGVRQHRQVDDVRQSRELWTERAALSAQAAWDGYRERLVALVVGDDLALRRMECYDGWARWSEAMVIESGVSFAASAVCPRTGIEVYAAFVETNPSTGVGDWRLRRRDGEGSEWERLGTIVSGVSPGPAWLEHTLGAVRELVFWWVDGSGLQRRSSGDQGDTWLDR